MTKNRISRIEAFSDGVFAIAITLLILEIKVPPVDSIHSVDDLWRALGHLWPSYFAFVLSFGFILIAWANHHIVLNFVEQSSPAFMYANGFLLLNIVLLPFPTGLLAEYITTDYLQPAVVFYCFAYVFQNISWNILFVTIEKSKLLKNDRVVVSKYNHVRKSSLYGLGIYIVITVLAFWFPMTALVLNTLLWFLWLGIGIRSPQNTDLG